MMQTRRQTLIEVCTGTAVGMLGSWLITVLCFTHIKDAVASATATVFLCTVWSLVRGYSLRRYFNARNK